jgi:hypothetical protein
MESPLALLFGAGAMEDDDHAHGDEGHGHSHGGKKKRRLKTAYKNDHFAERDSGQT